MVVGFTGIQPAILAARRLQWALQGLSEADPFSGTAAAILLHCTDHPAGQGVEISEADHAVLLTVSQAARGQILLSTKAAEILKDLPGLPLRSVTGAVLCELLWNNPGEKTNRSSDEEMLSEFIKQNGLESLAPASAPGQTVSPAGFAAGAIAAEASTRARGQEIVEGSTADSAIGQRAMMRLLIGAACAVVVVLVVAVAVVFSNKKQANPAPIAVQQSASTALASVPAVPQQQSPPSNPAPLPVVAAPAAPKNTNKAARTSRKQDETAPGRGASSEVGKTHETSPKTKPAGCDLDSSMIPKMLDQAEKTREEGDYAGARRRFLSVLACESTNARAREGLERTESAMKHR
jgi:hypothetical protein